MLWFRWIKIHGYNIGHACGISPCFARPRFRWIKIHGYNIGHAYGISPCFANTVTLAEVLKTAGYQTGMTGKWHVSNTFTQKEPQDRLAWLNHQKDFGPFSPLTQYPTSRGFDKLFGTIRGPLIFSIPQAACFVTHHKAGYFSNAEFAGNGNVAWLHPTSAS